MARGRYDRDYVSRYSEEEQVGGGEKSATRKWVDERMSVVESWLNKGVSGASKYSWGLLILLLVAVYAVYQIIRILVFFFN